MIRKLSTKSLPISLTPPKFYSKIIECKSLRQVFLRYNEDLFSPLEAIKFDLNWEKQWIIETRIKDATDLYKTELENLIIEKNDNSVWAMRNQVLDIPVLSQFFLINYESEN